MGNETISLNKKVSETEDKAAALSASEYKRMRYELVKSAISGLGFHSLDHPGRVAQNSVKLADACLAELGIKA